ncbi:hypothetical protein [Nocardia brasiliensis]|uniref:hypothetical protein n=1 Tax=Nocardia brasiliensis TaxID=37326 RepID=UPI002458CD1A|nr:hypothetical protein [Nocardia brasiliensis]
MAFTPVRMTAPDGRSCLVGSAAEREQLLARGYKLASAEADAKPEPKRPAPVKKPDTK